ncbi:MAG: alpha/beta fold hydrolase [Polyangiaceae bacterium]|nr:alpha/beta fold hydrolase [Polyangiaceae bacterium]
MYQSSGLPRRAFLGFELRARRSSDDGRGGIEVLRVTPEGAAARAGVCPGDRLVQVNDHEVSDPRELAHHVRTLEAGKPLRFVVDRAGEKRTLVGEASPLPIERVANADVHLEHITVFEHRQRLLLTTPIGAKPPFTAVLYLQGLGTQSCELSTDPDEPLRKLIEGFSASGLATLRVERSGAGDSEGPSIQNTNFFAEIAAYRAALDFLAHEPIIKNVILFGHSVGGMIAPVLAGEGANLAGIAVFGTSALRWVDCIVRATRRQRQLAGMSGEELEEYVADWAEMHTEVCRGGHLPFQVFATRPHLGWMVGSGCHGETMFGRHASFFQELERMDLVALWKTVRTNVLVMHGEYDWACGPDEGRALADAVAEVDAARVQFVELSAVGHDMRRHASIEESYASPRKGQWDERVVETFLKWAEEIAQ